MFPFPYFSPFLYFETQLPAHAPFVLLHNVKTVPQRLKNKNCNVKLTYSIFLKLPVSFEALAFMNKYTTCTQSFFFVFCLHFSHLLYRAQSKQVCLPTKQCCSFYHCIVCPILVKGYQSARPPVVVL